MSILPDLPVYDSIELEVPYPVLSCYSKYPRICGIYIIQNVLNDRCYVGASRNMCARWSQHRIELGWPGDRDIQVDFRQNPHVLFFRMIEICPEYQLREREQYWIREYQAHTKEWGYNGGRQVYSHKRSIERPISATPERRIPRV